MNIKIIPTIQILLLVIGLIVSLTQIDITRAIYSLILAHTFVIIIDVMEYDLFKDDK